jgi:hypothetical protein
MILIIINKRTAAVTEQKKHDMNVLMLSITDQWTL